MVKANRRMSDPIWQFRIRESWHAYDSVAELARAFHMEDADVRAVGLNWRAKGFDLKVMPDE